MLRSLSVVEGKDPATSLKGKVVILLLAESQFRHHFQRVIELCSYENNRKNSLTDSYLESILELKIIKAK